MNRLKPEAQLPRRRVLAAGALLAAAGLPLPAAAQAFPSKPLRLVVPYPPGGPADIVGRRVAEFMSKDLNHPVVVFNRDGADTILGAEMAAKAPPDGHTLALLGDSVVINTASGRRLPYDFERELIPITAVYSGPQAIMVAADSRFKNLQDLVQYGRASPGKLTYAGFGGASAVVWSTATFLEAAGVEALQVAYRGMTAAQNDLIGGRIDFILGGTTAALPGIAAGKLRALAIMSKQRSPLLPEVPTAIEQGVNAETAGWYGVFMTGGSPPEAVKVVHASLLRAMESKELRELYQKQGGAPTPMSTDDFRAFLQAELKRIRALAPKLKISFD
ncbi:MAG: Bug family tripartite tricarboxylate transporter substrate binding protein [Burkholderiaceae bacterium]